MIGLHERCGNYVFEAVPEHLPHEPLRRLVGVASTSKAILKRGICSSQGYLMSSHTLYDGRLRSQYYD